jgi:hypothetical protein
MKKKVCGAKLRGKKKTCQRSPMANGRCRLHGGGTPKGEASANFKHGRYSLVFQGKLAAKFGIHALDAKPLDLLPELAIQRTMLGGFVEKVSGKRSLTAGDAKNVSDLANDVVRTAAQIAKVRNEEALTVAELKFVKQGLMMLMEKYVPDPDRRRNFIAELSALIPERHGAEVSAAAELPAGAGAPG